MRSLRLLLPAMILGVCLAGWAQSPTYGLGKTPTAEEIRAMGYHDQPDGKELPPGSGTAKEGAPLYAQKCAACHGATGSGGPGSDVDKAAKRRQELHALSRALYQRWKRNGAALAVRDDSCGITSTAPCLSNRRAR